MIETSKRNGSGVGEGVEVCVCVGGGGSIRLSACPVTKVFIFCLYITYSVPFIKIVLILQHKPQF